MKVNEWFELIGEEENKRKTIIKKNRCNHCASYSFVDDIYFLSEEVVDGYCEHCLEELLRDLIDIIIDDKESTRLDVALFIAKCFNCKPLGVSVGKNKSFRDALEYYATICYPTSNYNRQYYAIGKFLRAFRKKEEARAPVFVEEIAPKMINSCVDKIVNIIN